jgi:hypothetical protein
VQKPSDEEVRQFVNPRPDLTEDAELWARLLLKAYAEDGQIKNGLAWNLHGFRCMGAHLRLGAKTVILERGEISEAEYQAWKAQWLEPFRERLVRILAELFVATKREGVAYAASSQG